MAELPSSCEDLDGEPFLALFSNELLAALLQRVSSAQRLRMWNMSGKLGNAARSSASWAYVKELVVTSQTAQRTLVNDGEVQVDDVCNVVISLLQSCRSLRRLHIGSLSNDPSSIHRQISRRMRATTVKCRGADRRAGGQLECLSLVGAQDDALVEYLKCCGDQLRRLRIADGDMRLSADGRRVDSFLAELKRFHLQEFSLRLSPVNSFSVPSGMLVGALARQQIASLTLEHCYGLEAYDLAVLVNSQVVTQTTCRELYVQRCLLDNDDLLRDAADSAMQALAAWFNGGQHAGAFPPGWAMPHNFAVTPTDGALQPPVYERLTTLALTADIPPSTLLTGLQSCRSLSELRLGPELQSYSVQDLARIVIAIHAFMAVQQKPEMTLRLTGFRDSRLVTRLLSFGVADSIKAMDSDCAGFHVCLLKKSHPHGNSNIRVYF